MRIFYSFLVILTAAFLFMLPITAAVYDFRTDVREDVFTVATAVSTSNATVVLLKSIYDDDVSTISLQSDLSTDVPLYYSYNTASRALLFTGLTDNTTRTMNVSYDVYALVGSDAADTIVSRVPVLWIICIIAFVPASLAAIFTGRA